MGLDVEAARGLIDQVFWQMDMNVNISDAVFRLNMISNKSFVEKEFLRNLGLSSLRIDELKQILETCKNNDDFLKNFIETGRIPGLNNEELQDRLVSVWSCDAVLSKDEDEEFFDVVDDLRGYVVGPVSVASGNGVATATAADQVAGGKDEVAAIPVSVDCDVAASVSIDHNNWFYEGFHNITVGKRRDELSVSSVPDIPVAPNPGVVKPDAGQDR